MTPKRRRCTLATMKTLGARIRELRDQKDLSTRELARKAQISIAFMSDIELGRRQPSEKVLAAIAKPLGTTLEDLQQYDPRPAVEEFKPPRMRSGYLAAASPAIATSTTYRKRIITLFCLLKRPWISFQSRNTQTRIRSRRYLISASANQRRQSSRRV